MDSDNLPKPENEQYDPNLEAQDEEVASGGNNRLVYILGAVILALVIGYLVLPKGNGSEKGMASVTPTFMLDDAGVTATAPVAADSAAAGEKDPFGAQAKPTETAKPAAKPAAAAPTTASNTASSATSSSAPASTREPARVAAAPEPGPAVAAEPTPAPAPAAPEPTAAISSGTVTTSGRIEDENGRPLVGATVLLKGSNKGTSTDANGFYSLDVPNGTNNVLVFGYGGYDDEEVPNRSNQPVNIALTPHAKSGKKRR